MIGSYRVRFLVEYEENNDYTPLICRSYDSYGAEDTFWYYCI